MKAKSGTRIFRRVIAAPAACPFQLSARGLLQPLQPVHFSCKGRFSSARSVSEAQRVLLPNLQQCNNTVT